MIVPVVDDKIFAMLGVIFLATLIRSAFGFGEALVAVPLLALFMPVETAAPLAVLLSITVAVVVVAREWHKIHFGSAWRLLLATLFGTPVGLLLLLFAAENVIKCVLALVIISFSSYCLLRRTTVELKDERMVWVFGFAAGILGGAYGMNGPPLAIYGTLRRWTAERFRATLQGYFLPASLSVLLGYALTGFWTPVVTHYYFLSLPPALAAIFLGGWLNRRMKGYRFIFYVHAGLIVVGITLLIQSLWNPSFKAYLGGY
jgi:uncharacterized membrane protein YfcA